jgi:hypothetical protein
MMELPMRIRHMACGVLLLSLFGAELSAEQAQNQSTIAPEQDVAAAREPLHLTIPAWVEPTPPPKRWGIFTLEPPESHGEVVRLSVPIGALIMRPVRAAGRVQRRRAEASARREVAQAIEDFNAAVEGGRAR